MAKTFIPVVISSSYFYSQVGTSSLLCPSLRVIDGFNHSTIVVSRSCNIHTSKVPQQITDFALISNAHSASHATSNHLSKQISIHSVARWLGYLPWYSICRLFSPSCTDLTFGFFSKQVNNQLSSCPNLFIFSSHSVRVSLTLFPDQCIQQYHVSRQPVSPHQ